MTLSLFAALRVGASAGKELHAWARDLAQHTPDVRITPMSSLHMTYAWLGNVVEDHVPSIASALEAAAASVPGPTACRTVSAGAYGDGRVLGVDVDIELLPLLDAARDRMLTELHPFAPGADSRAWRPHVSVLRAPHGHTLPNELLAAAAVNTPTTAWIVPELRLVASLPAPGGTQYRQLHAVPLGTSLAVR